MKTLFVPLFIPPSIYSKQNATYLRCWMLIVLLCFSLSSCQNKVIYQHYIDTPNQVWAKHNPIVFKAKVTKSMLKAKVSLQIRHGRYFTPHKLYGQCLIRTPAGKEDGVDLRIPIKKDGKYLGSGIGDLLEVSSTIYKKLVLEEVGMYEFVVSQESGKYLPQVLSVGLIVEKTDHN